MIGFKKLAQKITNLLLALALVSAQIFAPISAIVPKATAAIPDVCVSDVQGANDEPGQKDLTRFCQADDDAAGEITISWQWDEVAWSGNNTGDACALFDTNNNNFSNYAVCVTISGNPAAQSGVSPRIYTCNDSALEKCAGSSLVSGPYQTACSVSQTATDPFPGPPNKKKGAAYPNDTRALCVIKLSEVGAGAAVLKDVCSFPSQQPNSDPSDCVVTPTNNTAKYVEIVKDLNPAGSGTFSLRVDGIVKASGVGDGGSTGQVEVDGVDVDVSEVATGSTNLANFTTSIVCVDAADPSSSPIVSTSPTGETSRSAEFDFPRNVDEVLCTITNTQKTGNIQVVKDVINDNGGDKTYADFTFQVNGGSAQTFVATTSPDGARTVSVPLGTTYTITEPEANLNGYSTSYNGCVSVTPVVGQTQVCTITNNDNPPSLTLDKILSNAHGGNATEGDWTLTATGPTTISGAGSAGNADVVSGATFSAGTYTLSESAGPAGYTANSWTCTNGVTVNPNSQITIANGQTTVCTITNSEAAPALTLVKNVINNSGGTQEADDFVLRLNGTTQNSPVMSNSNLTATYTVANVDSNTAYTLTEDASLTYAGSAVSCVDDTTQLGVPHPVTLSEGQSVTCTITNNDISPTLQLIKSVINDNGGVLVASTWTLYATPETNTVGATEVSGAGGFEPTNVYANISYDLTETGLTGYTASNWDCVGGGTLVGNSLTLALAENVICTITNNDDAPSLTLVKEVTNDDGGERTANEWNLTATGTLNEPTNLSGNGGATSGTGFKADTYTLGESGPDDYESGDWSCTNNVTVNENNQIILANGQTTVCTITNDDIAPELYVAKRVLNDNGGTMMSGEFKLYVNGSLLTNPGKGGGDVNDNSVTYGFAGTVAGTEYSITEDEEDGYQNTGIECVDNDTQAALIHPVTLALNQSVTCTITNNDEQSYVIVDKTVTNDSGGSAVADDFDLTVDNNAVLDGIAYPVIPGTHTVGETNLPGYVAGIWGRDCDQNGSVTVALGDTKTCTITNDDVAPVLTLKKIVFSNNEDREASDWTLTATPTAGDIISGNGGDGVEDEQAVAGVNYTLTESTEIDGEFDASNWQCTSTAGTFSNPNGINNEIRMSVGADVTCTITNTERASVTVTKFNDYDRDGEKDDNEPVLPGWEFTLQAENECDFILFLEVDNGFDICDFFCSFFETDCYEYFEQQETGEDGTTTFTGLKPGVDHFLSETIQDGWTWSNTYCSYKNRESYGQIVEDNNYEVYASPGETVECFVGNYRDAYMLIEKTNNRPEPTVVGDIVTYTLTVTVPEDSNPVYDASVTDLPPEGFNYIPGSETASKPGAFLVHPYASPGIWSLGDLYPGDVVTLAYQTRIADSASAGTYPDLAFAEGCDMPVDGESVCGEENAVLANVTHINEDGTPFVGTEVTIKAPQVLAANITRLVDTGAADIWRNLAVGTLLMGVAFATLFGRQKKGGRA